MDPYGDTLGTVLVQKPQSLRVLINGKEEDAFDLHRDETLTFWVPESVFSARPADRLGYLSRSGHYIGGAPRLTGQHPAYIERQLGSFKEGLRRNDINEQMRTSASQLTATEMHAVAELYGIATPTRVAER
jgi:hypothetical protein